VKPKPCTSWTHNRQHLSVDLADDGRGGHDGTALCRPGGVAVNVFDYHSINRQLGPYRSGKPPIVPAELPLCRSCERAAAKLGVS
jgi:hypothetical protein